jgi:hypothetical protein
VSGATTGGAGNTLRGSMKTGASQASFFRLSACPYGWRGDALRPPHRRQTAMEQALNDAYAANG